MVSTKEDRVALGRVRLNSVNPITCSADDRLAVSLLCFKGHMTCGVCFHIFA